MFNARLSPRISRKAGQLPVLQQSAALCYRVKQGQPEVLLITTRKSGRWIIPKGWLIDGLTPSETARQEAWEEAGVLGECRQLSVGCFSYYKHRSKKGSVQCLVDVYPLFVQSTVSRFPERAQRQRKWFTPERAAGRVNSGDLALLLRKVGLLPH
ncbi:NUDIX hydrolase [Ruegeria meonggei]|uniref:NUDIX domain protein n=1 Tax=Ruegeria meonggei TaxID=1446476 RepID=A0A1X7ABA9_9RHOB|nr:NUDIX hydrolase [Ruegeria meonggei]SLN75028.1 NUDIX domain protein [Ruegeria meonggei]